MRDKDQWKMNESRTDANLIARLATEPAALEEFYVRHIERVLRFLSRRCATPEDLADAAADTFVEVIGASGRFDDRRGDPIPWLLGIARNCSAAQARRRRRERAVQALVAGHRLLDDSDYARLEARIDAARFAPSLQRAMAALSTRERELIELVDLEGLAPAQAATVLRVSQPAARMRLARARRRLRGLIENDPGSRLPRPTTREGEIR